MQTRTYTLFLAAVLFMASPLFAQAASVYIDPGAGTYGPGDTFIETIRLDNGNECINAANIVLTYPKDTLRAVDFSRGDSIFSLWVVEPKLDVPGSVTFAGGIPGGYCGHIAGDAGTSNVLGKVVFTVVSARAHDATIGFAPATAVYLNDGSGTAAKVTTEPAKVAIVATAQQTNNPWLAEVTQDKTQPQPFSVDVESTVGVFGGKFYIVFSTTDKESGIDHYEIFERGGWKPITSPYQPENQSLLGVGDIQVRAVDKAGNIRLGTYSATSTPKRQYSSSDFVPLAMLLVILLFVVSKIYVDHKRMKGRTLPEVVV